jgi:hypothetical protein
MTLFYNPLQPAAAWLVKRFRLQMHAPAKPFFKNSIPFEYKMILQRKAMLWNESLVRNSDQAS